MAAMGKGVRKAADYSEATSAGAARRRMWLGNGSNGQRRPQGRRFLRSHIRRSSAQADVVRQWQHRQRRPQAADLFACSARVADGTLPK